MESVLKGSLLEVVGAILVSQEESVRGVGGREDGLEMLLARPHQPAHLVTQTSH